MYTNCIDCPAHEVLLDSSGSDWFNDDDVKVVCKHMNRTVTDTCRPYNTRKESETPDWCPFNKNIVMDPYTGEILKKD